MADDEILDETAPATDEGGDVHDLALKRWDAIIIASQEQRALNLAARRFVGVPGAMWEGDGWGQARENEIRIEIPKAAIGANKITDDYREHRIAGTFRPVDKGADEQTAETLNGICRADFYRSHGQQVLDNAFDEGMRGGMGALRLTTSYVDKYDPEDDRQQIDFGLITDADQSVFFDLDAKLYDKSDARFCFVRYAVSRAAYVDTYDDDPDSWPAGLWKPYFDWATPDVVYVVEYYLVEEKKQKLHILRHSETDEEQRVWAKDVTPEELADLITQGWVETRVRNVPRRRVRKYLMSGGGIIGKAGGQVIAGDQIPIIPYYGQRYFIDNLERCQGHVQSAMDTNRVYNTIVSSVTETAMSSPRSVPMFTPEQVGGNAEMFARVHVDRLAYLPVNPVTQPDGSQQPMGPVGYLEPAQMSQAAAALLQITSQDIAETTRSQDGAGEVKSNVSAEAMDIAATRTDASSRIYIDNFGQTVKRAWEVWLSAAKEIYVETDREIDTVDADDNQGTATINTMGTDERGVFGPVNDLASGRYKVIVDVSEATATRRDKTVRFLMNLAQISAPFDPELAGAAVNTATLNIDGEGMADFQEWARKRALGNGLVKPTPEEEQEMQAAQQQQQPDPQAVYLGAAAKEKEASAALKQGQIEEAKAATAQKLADADNKAAQAEQTRQETRHSPITKAMDFMKGLMPKPTPKQ